MNFSYKLTLKERMAIYSNCLAMGEFDREDLERECKNSLDKLRIKLSTQGYLNKYDERDFITGIEFATMCHAIKAGKIGYFGTEFRNRTRSALMTHYTSALQNDAETPAMQNLFNTSKI